MSEPTMFKDILFNGLEMKFLTTICKSQDSALAIQKIVKAANAFDIRDLQPMLDTCPVYIEDLFPPFNCFWIEGYGKIDKKPLTKEQREEVDRLGSQFGQLVIVTESTKSGINQYSHADLEKTLSKFNDEEEFYIYESASFVKHKGQLTVGPIYRAINLVTKKGEYVQPIGYEDKIYSIIINHNPENYKDSPVLYSFLKNYINSASQKADVSVDSAALLSTLAVLNAKNVKMQKQSYDLNEYSKKRLKRSGVKNQYYTLVVTKPGIQQESSSTGEHKGTRPLHLCRGHLARYEKKGLFGRLFGTFFIPSHVRGDKKNGIIKKDYRIKP